MKSQMTKQAKITQQQPQSFMAIWIKRI